MGKWQSIYQSLEADGVDPTTQLRGTAWLDRFIPRLGDTTGEMLDLGCGMGADMLRCAQLGYQPHGLDLEERATQFVNSRYGFSAQQHNLGDLLPFDDATFSFVLSRFAIHYLRPSAARKLFGEVLRVLKPGANFLFAVNSETHRCLDLQDDYRGATEVEPHFWRLPHDMDRTILFYTPELAANVAGPGWEWLHLADERFDHWAGIEKRAVVGLAQRR